MSSKSASLFIGLLAMWLSCTLSVDASCGLGEQPTYQDIQAVRYTRTSCFGKCPAYEVLFSYFGAYYAGRRWVNMTGTYEAETTTNSEFRKGITPQSLQLAAKLLERHHFFDLSIVPDLVTDVPHYIIAVQRCDVTTKLDWPAYPERRDIEELFDDLDAITNSMHWTKTSDSDASPLDLLAQIYP